MLLKLLDLADHRVPSTSRMIAQHQPGRAGRAAGLDGDDEETQFLTIVEGADQRLR